MKGEQKHFMSWIGWAVVIIMVFNVVFFSALIIYDLIREWRDKHEHS